jgi:dihydrofolate reductase
MINAILAANEDGIIGVGNELPWRIPNDLKFFKEKTTGHAVIMGRNTYDSILAFTNGKPPLPGRFKYVITRREIVGIPADTRAVMITENSAGWIKQVEKKHGEVFVIGGQQIYSMFNGHYDRVFKTRVLFHINQQLPDLAYDPIDLTNFKLLSEITHEASDAVPYHQFQEWQKC